MQVQQIGGGEGLSIQCPSDWRALDRAVFTATAEQFTFSSLDLQYILLLYDFYICWDCKTDAALSHCLVCQKHTSIYIVSQMQYDKSTDMCDCIRSHFARMQASLAALTHNPLHRGRHVTRPGHSEEGSSSLGTCSKQHAFSLCFKFHATDCDACTHNTVKFHAAK